MICYQIIKNIAQEFSNQSILYILEARDERKINKYEQKVIRETLMFNLGNLDIQLCRFYFIF